MIDDIYLLSLKIFHLKVLKITFSKNYTLCKNVTVPSIHFI